MDLRGPVGAGAGEGTDPRDGVRPIGGLLFTGLTARFMKGQTDPNQGLSYSIKRPWGY